MAADLFAGIPVSDFQKAKPWYERLFGGEPSFMPYDTEAVWEINEHGYVFIVEKSKGAGHAEHTIFVEDLDAIVAGISDRGIEPSERETYGNGVRKVIYRDDEGNEIGYGGAPLG
jgi:predicted enzyme related to lactoylglutathione lyase